MSASLTGNGKLKEWSNRSILVPLDKIWIKYLIIPALSYIPPAYIAYELKQPSIDKAQSFWDYIAIFIHNSPYLSVGFIPLFTILNIILIKVIESHKNTTSGINVKALTTLFNVIDTIVGSKAKRFSECEEKFRDDSGKSTEEVFNEITQPRQQIALVPAAVHTFFDSIDEHNVDIYVTLVKIENEKAVGWENWAPFVRKPKIDIELLRRAESTVNHCIRLKDIIIIEDLEKEADKRKGRQYIPNASEKGSLICYPVLQDQGHVSYVITISAEKKYYFQQTKLNMYRWVLDKFAARISLEYCLLFIKTKCGVLK